MNFTFYDEINQTIINASSYPTTLLLNFKYWLGSGNEYKIYNFQNLSSSKNSYEFCTDYNSTYTIDMDMQYYSALSYADRSYYFRNQTINYNKRYVILYSILSDSATKFTTTLKDGTDLVSNALVGVWKYFVGLGEYRQVLVGLTDDKGSFLTNIDLDQNYIFTIIKDGYQFDNQTKQATCASTPCYIDLNLGDATLSAYKELYDYFAQNIIANITYNQTTKNITLNFYDITGTANYWRLHVYLNNYQNESIITICDLKSYSSVGSLVCNYDGYEGDIFAKYYISRSPEKLVDFISFVNSSVPSILGASAILASILIIVVIVFSGTRNPVIAIVLLPVGLTVLKLIGFLPLDWSWIIGLIIFCFIIIGRINT